MYETVQNSGRSARGTQCSRKADKLEARSISCVDVMNKSVYPGQLTRKNCWFLMNVL